MLKIILFSFCLAASNLTCSFAAPPSALESAGAASAFSPEAVPAPVRAGRDLTAEFLNVRKSPGQGLEESKIAELRKCKVLLVRGFMTGGYVEPFEILGHKVWIGRYFNDQKEVLRDLGVDFSMVDIDSAMTPSHNAAKVALAIRGSEKPVIIISHSDGGMYVLQSLVENPELAVRVRGFIPLQAPFSGTPVADYVRGKKVFSAMMAALLGHFGGTLESLESMTLAERGGYQEANREAVGAIVSKLNIICFASWKAEKHHKLDTLLELPRDFMLKRGLNNDGLTPADSSILTGADYIKLEGADHVVTVMAADMVLEFDRRAFTRALLAMIISS
ncbi:MAG: hypothetical protein AUJ51_09095 [Elusimicrobia bacterium CG1_02_56_21]|nr:MAG: hypothetical protein AUJ51_09095 [Elusimicrobia bacterium CG1_02_56_21]